MFEALSSSQLTVSIPSQIVLISCIDAFKPRYTNLHSALLRPHFDSIVESYMTMYSQDQHVHLRHNPTRSTPR